MVEVEDVEVPRHNWVIEYFGQDAYRAVVGPDLVVDELPRAKRVAFGIEVRALLHFVHVQALAPHPSSDPGIGDRGLQLNLKAAASHQVTQLDIGMSIERALDFAPEVRAPEVPGNFGALRLQPLRFEEASHDGFSAPEDRVKAKNISGTSI